MVICERCGEEIEHGASYENTGSGRVHHLALCFDRIKAQLEELRARYAARVDAVSGGEVVEAPQRKPGRKRKAK